jgi:hypothetical protein
MSAQGRGRAEADVLRLARTVRSDCPCPASARRTLIPQRAARGGVQ